MRKCARFSPYGKRSKTNTFIARTIRPPAIDVARRWPAARAASVHALGDNVQPCASRSKYASVREEARFLSNRGPGVPSTSYLRPQRQRPAPAAPPPRPPDATYTYTITLAGAPMGTSTVAISTGSRRHHHHRRTRRIRVSEIHRDIDLARRSGNAARDDLQRRLQCCRPGRNIPTLPSRPAR